MGTEAKSDEKPAEKKTEADTTVGSEKAVEDAKSADGATPDADRVAMVSIDVNGNPAQSENFEVIGLPEDATDEHKAAAHNEAGRKLGAKHVTKDKDGK